MNKRPPSHPKLLVSNSKARVGWREREREGGSFWQKYKCNEMSNLGQTNNRLLPDRCRIVSDVPLEEWTTRFCRDPNKTWEQYHKNPPRNKSRCVCLYTTTRQSLYLLIVYQDNDRKTTARPPCCQKKTTTKFPICRVRLPYNSGQIRSRGSHDQLSVNETYPSLLKATAPRL